MRTPRSAKVIIAIAVLASLAVAAFVAAPSMESQLVSLMALLALMLVLPVSIWHAWRHRKAERWRSGIPLVACLVAVPVAVLVGGTYRSLDFRYRRLPAYAAVVRQIQAGELTVATATDVPSEIRHLATAIHVHDEERDDTTIEFLWGGGFPVNHTVYIFRSSGLPPPISDNWDRRSCRWSGIRRLNEHWFAAHD